jgi:hypothetical protein
VAVIVRVLVMAAQAADALRVKITQPAFDARSQK